MNEYIKIGSLVTRVEAVTMNVNLGTVGIVIDTYYDDVVEKIYYDIQWENDNGWWDEYELKLVAA